jgi:hypothetical protein
MAAKPAQPAPHARSAPTHKHPVPTIASKHDRPTNAQTFHRCPVHIRQEHAKARSGPRRPSNTKYGANPKPAIEAKTGAPIIATNGNPNCAKIFTATAMLLSAKSSWIHNSAVASGRTAKTPTSQPMIVNMTIVTAMLGARRRSEMRSRTARGGRAIASDSR